MSNPIAPISSIGALARSAMPSLPGLTPSLDAGTGFAEQVSTALGNLNQQPPAMGSVAGTSGPSPLIDAGAGLTDKLSSALGNLNELQHTADALSQQVATGNLEDTHKALIAMEKASLALDYTLEVRNKVIDAYQEIMRTQV